MVTISPPGKSASASSLSITSRGSPSAQATFSSGVLKLVGTPIRIEYKGGDNPYEGNKNTLTDRQVNKKRRLMSHHKKAEKKRKDKRK